MFCPECGQIVGPEPLDTRFLNETPDRGLVASLFGRCFAKMRGRPRDPASSKSPTGTQPIAGV